VGGRHGEVDVEVEVEATSPVGASPDLEARDIQGAALAGDMATASTRAGDLGHSVRDAAARMPVVRRMVPLRCFTPPGLPCGTPPHFRAGAG
jgi:hypothetical protein